MGIKEVVSLARYLAPSKGIIYLEHIMIRARSTGRCCYDIDETFHKSYYITKISLYHTILQMLFWLQFVSRCVNLVFAKKHAVHRAPINSDLCTVCSDEATASSEMLLHQLWN